MSLPAVEPAAWVEPAPQRPLPFWASLRADVIAHVPPADRNRSRLGWALLTATVALRSAGFHLAFFYRLAHTLHHRAGWPGRVLSLALFWWNRHWYGCTIPPAARLYGGLILPHPYGITVAPGVVVGPRAWIFQNVTIGGAPRREGAPQVGSDARLFVGAVLTGPITVGDQVAVGANAVVHRNVPPRTAVRSAPVEFASLPDLPLDEE
jgi:serine O-acetyltransferase